MQYTLNGLTIFLEHKINMFNKYNIILSLFIFFLVFISCKSKIIEKTLSDIEYNELYDKIQQKELEDYLLNNNDVTNFGYVFFNDFNNKYG